MAARRFGGWAVRVGIGAAVLLTAQPPDRLPAQDSQFGIRGLGTPGKPENVRARSTGGAFAAFDPLAPLLDASLADARRMTAGITGATSFRAVRADTIESSLRASRFPAFVIAGPLTSRIVVGGGFTTYLDRTFGIITRDTIVLRGEPEALTDEIRSDGAITDLRVALGARLSPRLAVGVGFHLLTGSTRVSAIRRFDDSTTYRTSTQRDEVAYEGMGGSVNALLDLTAGVRVAGWFRTDSKLRASLGGTTTAEDDLPLSYGASALWRAGSEAAVAGAVAWRQWAGVGPNSFDTFNWSLGAELGAPSTLFRFGVRGGQLPFGIGSQPTEFGFSGGLGKQFAGGRGRIDVGLERLQRKGTGLNERVWTFLLGLTVRP